MPKIRAFLLAFNMLFIMTACSDEHPSEPQMHRSDYSAGSAAPHGLQPRTLRDEFRDLARRAPGFTGVWIDDAGELVVSAAADELSPTLRAEVTRWLTTYRRPELARRTARLNRVRYDYVVLVGYLDQAKEAAAHLPGVISFGIDVKVGRVDVGVTDAASASAARSALAAASLPADAWTVDVYGPITNVQAGLQSSFSTLMAGIQTSRHWSNTNGACSIGLVGYGQMEGMPYPYFDENVRIYTTAGHCTSNELVMESNQFGQPSMLARFVGVEIDKAQVYSQGSSYCGSYPYCRFADVAVIRIADHIPHSAGVSAVSSKTTPPTNPPYRGTQAYSGTGVQSALVGDWVTKVGRTTGQTSARVDHDCTDIQSLPQTPGLWTLCTQRASLGVQGGDSGGIVFIPRNSAYWWTPLPAGVVQSSASNGTSWYSPIHNVNNALDRRYVYTF